MGRNRFMDKFLTKGEHMKIVILAIAILISATQVFAETTYEKVSDNEIKVINTLPVVINQNVYNYEFLLSQRIAIQEMKDRDNLLRDKELAEIDAVLEECGKLGIIEKPVEKPIEPLLERL